MVEMYGNLGEIDRQIDYWNRMKNAYQSLQPNPINIFNNTNPGMDFEARIIDKNTRPSDVIVSRKTAFICFEEPLLTIKEVNGDMKEYKLEIPKTKEQLENEELKARIKELEKELGKRESE